MAPRLAWPLGEHGELAPAPWTERLAEKALAQVELAPVWAEPTECRALLTERMLERPPDVAQLKEAARAVLEE